MTGVLVTATTSPVATSRPLAQGVLSMPCALLTQQLDPVRVVCVLTEKFYYRSLHVCRNRTRRG